MDHLSTTATATAANTTTSVHRGNLFSAVSTYIVNDVFQNFGNADDARCG